MKATMTDIYDAGLGALDDRLQIDRQISGSDAASTSATSRACATCSPLTRP